MKRKVRRQGLKLSTTEGGKEGKHMTITSCKYLESRFHECSKNEGMVLATSVQNAGGRLETENQAAGRAGEGEKDEV